MAKKSNHEQNDETYHAVQINHISAKDFFELRDMVRGLLEKEKNEEKTASLPRTLTFKEACKALRIPTYWVMYRLIQTGKIKPLPRERKCAIQFSREEITRYLNYLSKNYGS